MKANELSAKDLMIGDWVCLPSIMSADKYQVEVLEIQDDCIKSYVGGKKMMVRFKYIEPIPLTPEILEKNGFEDIGDDTYQLEENPCWFWVDFFRHNYGCEYDTSTYEYEDSEHRLKLYGIPSVHELQHALRLCGIEKEIEL